MYIISFTNLEQQIARIIHPEVIWRVARLGEMDREATLQDELAALPPRTAPTHALGGRWHALEQKTHKLRISLKI